MLGININNNNGMNQDGTRVRLRQTDRCFPTPAGAFFALRGADLELRAGEAVALVGPSGSGKSTLLQLIGGVDRATSGEIWVAGIGLHQLNEDALTAFRGRHVGIVFQFFQLLPTLTALENVMVAMDFVGCVPARERRERALELLSRVGVVDQAGKLPAALSGGQQQRVAIARALANDPPLVIADEPTGNLDSHTGQQVLALLAELAKVGKTVLVATHERDLERHFQRVIELCDGRVLHPDLAKDSTRAATCTA